MKLGLKRLKASLSKLFLQVTNESPSIKSIRDSQEFIYLYHGTSSRNVDNINKNGLKTSKQNVRVADIIGKEIPVLFFTSNPKYALAYSLTILKRLKQSDVVVFRAKLSTKFIHLALGVDSGDGEYVDEYIYTERVPPEDLEAINVKTHVQNNKN